MEFSMPDPVRVHVRKILRAYGEVSEAETAKIQEIEAAGGRIITGGQIGGGRWQILDWRTGVRLAHGDRPESYNEARARLDPEHRWQHVDRIAHEIEMSEPAPTDGVPPSLAQALREWVDSRGTSNEEIAEVAGWDVAEVARCLGYEND
ncbi:hypothetical protein ACFV0L_41345 [Streptosporangium canum]|uniref:hypothetical protein n=1 Tax=Streptosporangium canum TaxID=324952 RepID=UPI00367FCAA4